jgi:hypothetical protein
MEHLNGSSLAIPTYIRLGWKDLQGTNTLAYYKHSLIVDVKSFTLGPEKNHKMKY